MKIKLIALDMDGTLLNSEKHLSEKNRKVLEVCMGRGIHIVPATGRTVDGLPDEVIKLKGVRYAITTNGALLQDLKESFIIDSRKLSNEKALELLGVIQQFDAMYDPYIDGRGISEAKFYENLSAYGLPPEIQKLVHKTRDLVPDIKQYVKDSKKSVEKINLFFGDMDERARAKEILLRRRDIIVTSSITNNLEINHPEATKGKSLKRLAEYLGLSMDETMAIGDGENDISMLKAAGVGISMANASAEVQKSADDVTTDNDNDGVARAIERLVFN